MSEERHMTAKRAPEDHRSGVGGHMARTHPAPVPTHSSPLAGASGAASLGLAPPCEQSGLAGCTGITHPGTHPVSHTRPGTHPLTPLYPHTTTVHHTLTACTYGRFWDIVGESRGVNTGLVSGSQAGITPLLRFTRPFDWVYDWF